MIICLTRYKKVLKLDFLVFCIILYLLYIGDYMFFWFRFINNYKLNNINFLIGFKGCINLLIEILSKYKIFSYVF